MVCDFLHIYGLRIDPEAGEFADLSSVQWIRYASRLTTYDGVVSARLRAFREETHSDPAPAPAGQQIEASPQNLTTNPLLAHFIDYG